MLDPLEVPIPYASHSDTWRITGLGDLHVGNVGFQEDEFVKARQAILDNDIHVILMGDLIDGICCRDKRHDYQSLDPRFFHDLYRYVDATYDHLITLLEPLRDNIIAIVRGNHEDTLLSDYQRDITYDLARELNKPYLGISGFVQLAFKRSRFCRRMNIFCHHGSGSSITRGGKVNRVDRLLQGYDADIYMIGHMHEPMSWKSVSLGVSKNGKSLGLRQRYRAGMVCSSFLATVGRNTTLYGEKRMYNPVAFELNYLEITPETGRIRKVEA
jgi:predicted phosphodiesterase